MGLLTRLRGGAYRVPTPPPTLGEQARAVAALRAPGALYDPDRPRGFYIMSLSPQTDYSAHVIDYWNGRDWYYNGVRDMRIMRVVQALEVD